MILLYSATTTTATTTTTTKVLIPIRISFFLVLLFVRAIFSFFFSLNINVNKYFWVSLNNLFRYPARWEYAGCSNVMFYERGGSQWVKCDEMILRLFFFSFFLFIPIFRVLLSCGSNFIICFVCFALLFRFFCRLFSISIAFIPLLTLNTLALKHHGYSMLWITMCVRWSMLCVSSNFTYNNQYDVWMARSRLRILCLCDSDWMLADLCRECVYVQVFVLFSLLFYCCWLLL